MRIVKNDRAAFRAALVIGTTKVVAAGQAETVTFATCAAIAAGLQRPKRGSRDRRRDHHEDPERRGCTYLGVIIPDVPAEAEPLAEVHGLRLVHRRKGFVV